MADLDFTINQGTDFRRLIRIKHENRTPMDLTGREFVGAVKESYRSIKAVFKLDLRIADQSLEMGDLHLHIPASKTRNLRLNEPTEYYYDIKQILDDEETIILAGRIVVIPRVTR